MENAYQTWHCGNETADCHGEELAERGDGLFECLGCDRVYDPHDDGRLVEGGD